jgi:hypothetical protein
MTDVTDVSDVPEGRAELISEPLRQIMAVLSGAAGIIHLAMVPTHMDEWAAEGAAFALAGWSQVVVALLLLLSSPSRRLLQVVVASNLAFVAAWAVTRTVGTPFGPHSGHAESLSVVDGAAVAFEVLLIGVATIVLVRPELLGGSSPVARLTGSATAAPVALFTVLVVTTAVLASPSASNHAHASHGGHGDGTNGETAMEGHGHGGTNGEGHLAAVLREDDRGLSDLRNGHHHEIVERELDAATQAELDEQLAVTREVAARYPTVADATAGGFVRIGPYFPGIGAHYRNPSDAAMNPTGEMTREALLNPLAIIYDGSEPTSRVAGFMYLSMSEEEPEGFAGDNDVWHYHEDLCLDYQPGGEINVPFGLDNQSTPEQCQAAGGEMLPISPYMVHVWSAPGYDDDPDVSVFHEVHTDLDCVDGSFHMLPVEEWIDHQLNVCQAGAA